MVGTQKREWLHYRPTHAARLAIILTVSLVAAISVHLTGGFTSPLKVLLFLPVFLGSLSFGFLGGVAVAFVVCLFGGYLILHAADDTSTITYVQVQAGAFMLCSVVFGLFGGRLLRSMHQAMRSAEELSARAKRAEWLTEVSLLMQSMPDLEQALSVALIRLDELMPFDSAAIFLRDEEEDELNLVQSMGLPMQRLGVSTIPASIKVPLCDGLSKPITSSENTQENQWPYSEIDRLAESWMAVPLCTADTLFGVLYVGKQSAKGFTDQEQSSLSQFAAHIVNAVQRARFQEMATTDLLTGLGNRRAFWQHLRRDTERVRRYMHPLSLLLIDIDHFKQVNDTYGHLTGDAVLSQLGRLISGSIRESDFGARYGGEELAVICPETAAGDAQRLAERLRRTVAEMDFHATDGKLVPITISIGTATMPDHAAEPNGLVEVADVALYEAKHSGRNRVCSASEAAVLR